MTATHADGLAALAEEYEAYIDALHAHLGLRAEATTTGGNCAALVIPIDGGHLMVYDQEESLSWDVRCEDGLAVSLFRPSRDFPDENEEVRTLTHHWKSPRILVDLVAQVLKLKGPTS